MNNLNWIKPNRTTSLYHTHLGSLWLSAEDLENYPLGVIETYGLTIEKEDSYWVFYAEDHTMQDIADEQEFKGVKTLKEAKAIMQYFAENYLAYYQEYEIDQDEEMSMAEFECKQYISKF